MVSSPERKYFRTARAVTLSRAECDRRRRTVWHTSAGSKTKAKRQGVVQEPVRARQFSINKAGDELCRQNKELGCRKVTTDRRSPETGTQNNGRMESGVDKATKRRRRLQGCLSPFIVPQKGANRRLGGSQRREGTDRKVEAFEGNTMGTTESEIVCTRQERIAELAGQEPKFRLLSLNKNLDMDWLREAYRRTRKDPDGRHTPRWNRSGNRRCRWADAG